MPPAGQGVQDGRGSAASPSFPSRPHRVHARPTAFEHAEADGGGHLVDREDRRADGGAEMPQEVGISAESIARGVVVSERRRVLGHPELVDPLADVISRASARIVCAMTRDVSATSTSVGSSIS